MPRVTKELPLNLNWSVVDYQTTSYYTNGVLTSIVITTECPNCQEKTDIELTPDDIAVLEKLIVLLKGLG